MGVLRHGRVKLQETNLRDLLCSSVMAEEVRLHFSGCWSLKLPREDQSLDCELCVCLAERWGSSCRIPHGVNGVECAFCAHRGSSSSHLDSFSICIVAVTTPSFDCESISTITWVPMSSPTRTVFCSVPCKLSVYDHVSLDFCLV